MTCGGSSSKRQSRSLEGVLLQVHLRATWYLFIQSQGFAADGGRMLLRTRFNGSAYYAHRAVVAAFLSLAGISGTLFYLGVAGAAAAAGSDNICTTRDGFYGAREIDGVSQSLSPWPLGANCTYTRSDGSVVLETVEPGWWPTVALGVGLVALPFVSLLVAR